MLRDALRLAVGTLTAVPVRAPVRIDRARAGWAMALAPLAVLPLGLAVALIGWVGIEFHLPPLVIGAVAVGALALGSRGMHLDGLADTADGLTASYDRERALEVMHRGDTGPSGAAAIVLVLLLQVTALGAVVGRDGGWLVAGVLACASRVCLALLCVAGVRAAASSRLGATVAGSVPRWAAVTSWLLVAVLVSLALAVSDHPWWQGMVVAGAGLVVTAVLLRRCLARLGGITGDVLGAGIELTLAVMLVAASARW